MKKALRRCVVRMVASMTRRRDETRLREEVEEHLALQTAENIRAGMSLDEARRQAVLKFGAVEAVKEDCRDHRGLPLVEQLVQDIRYALRGLRKNPGFTSVAVLTLALGIGATTAIFSFVNAVVLRPLPFDNSARLVLVQPEPRMPPPGPIRVRTVAPADFLEWQLRNDVFDEIAGFSGATLSLTQGGEPERLQAATVTTRFFDVLGVTPLTGRTFLTSEGEAGANQVAVIGSTLWRRRFHSDPKIVGRPIVLDGNTFTIVGVMPDGFSFPQDLLLGTARLRPVELWTPLVLQWGDRSNAFLQVIARLKSEVRIEQAQSEIEAIAAHVAEGIPPDRRVEGYAIRVRALYDRVVQEVRPLLLVFLGAVGFLLLIACSNVANLLTARSVVRRREVALRTALGARRSRLVWQFLTESVILGLLGGVGGWLVATQGVKVLSALVPRGALPRMNEIAVDSEALAFTLVVSFLAALTFGLAPAVRLSGTDVSNAIKQSSATLTPRSRFLNMLAVGEMAMAFVLLAGAGLMINSFWRLASVDPGFSPDRMLTLTVSLPERDYRTSTEMRAFSLDVLDRLRHVRGVARAAAVNWLPLGGALITGDFTAEGLERPEGLVAAKPAVSSEYFRTMGIPLVRGRSFAEWDTDRAPGVAIVTEGLARRLWPGADPIGKRLKLGFGREEPWLSVVGVVGDVKQRSLADETLPAIYVPLLQAPRPFLLRDLTFVVSTADADPSVVASSVRREVLSVDPNLPFDRIQTMRELIGDSVAEPRFRTAVLGAFASAAVALVAIGMLGVLAYSVTQRTREIGVRIALGASRSGVLRLVVGQALWITLTGLAIGSIAALALTRLLSRFLFDVRPTDPATFVAAAAVLLGASLIASYIPARRAARVDPLVALRYE